MEYFGFGTSSDLTNPLGVMVKAATDNLRIGPDWAKNLEICDQINLHKDNIELAMRAIRRRLLDNDHQTVSLSLTLLETCMKNCGMEFAARFDRSLMDEVINVAMKEHKGMRNKEDALRLIQQWGRAYESCRSIPLFFETFMSLKARGVSFPREDEHVTTGYEVSSNKQIVPQKSATSGVQSSTPLVMPPPARQSTIPEQEEDEFIRLQQDLSVVMEKVRLCREILMVSPGIQHDDALADIIGFLEACRDRMVDVIEAGTQGLLGEDLFALCLKVNDSVLRTLEAEKSGIQIPIDDEDAEHSKVSGTGTNITDMNLLELTPTTQDGKQISSLPVEEDLFGSLEARVSKTSQIQNSQVSYGSASSQIFDDPFGGAFGTYPSVSTTNHVPAPENAINTPFDDFSNPSNVTSSHLIATPASLSSAKATLLQPATDDFDALFDASPSKPSHATNNKTFEANVSNKTDSELEDFFATLDVSK